MNVCKCIFAFLLTKINKHFEITKDTKTIGWWKQEKFRKQKLMHSSVNYSLLAVLLNARQINRIGFFFAIKFKTVFCLKLLLSGYRH